MDYIQSTIDAIWNYNETYFEKAERLKCCNCKKLSITDCHCRNCVTDENVINSYYNSMKYENNKEAANSLNTILIDKIQSAENNTDTSQFASMLAEVEIFLKNNTGEDNIIVDV